MDVTANYWQLCIFKYFFNVRALDIYIWFDIFGLSFI